MEERYSLVNHKASFKSQGLQEFSEKVTPYIDQSIDRKGSEKDSLRQIVTKYKGKKVQLVMTPRASGGYNAANVNIIDWNEEKSKGLPIYKRFLESPFPADYVPFAYEKKDDGKETLFLCEILDTPSPWIRCYNNESSNTWAGHYFGSSLRNAAIIPYTMPERYFNMLAQDVVVMLEAIEKEGIDAKLKEAGFENVNHLKYVIEIAKGNIQEGFAEAQKLLDEVNEKLKGEMNKNVEAAKKGGLLDPVKGVSLEDWAAANVKISQAMPLNDVLKVLGVEKPVWDEISATWMDRMSQDTTFAISKVYGDAFTNPNIGKFAQASGATSAPAGGGTVDKVKSDFDLYVKIMCHQNMGAAQGLDANAVLKQYGLTAGDWGMIGGHWAPQMTTNLDLMMKMSTLMQKYNTEFASAAPAKAGDDISF